MNNRKKWRHILAIFLLLFGLATIKEGGAVLFFDSAARAAAGNYVPFVLWFNFLAGFAYITASIGIFLNTEWANRLAVAIAALTAIIFIALGIHILRGGLYETRTLIAMTLRTSIWTFTAILLKKNYN